MSWKAAPRSLLSESGLIVSWLVRLLVFIALAGLVVTEIGSVLLARYNAAEAASAAAADAAFAVRAKGIEGRPEDRAQAIAESKGCRLLSVSIDKAAQTVSVKVEKIAPTFLIKRIGPLKKFRIAIGSHTTSYADR